MERIVIPLKCDYFNENNIPNNFLERINQEILKYGWKIINMLSTPFFLGLGKVETEISLFLPPQNHVFNGFYENDNIGIFFIFMSVTGYIIEWPPTFEIQLFGKWMKKVNGDHKLYHYLPKILLKFDEENKIPIRCDFTQPFFLFFQISSKSDEFIIYNQIPKGTTPSPIIFSPLSGQRMLYPVRTLHCHHDQCIELSELISQLNIDGSCPLCHCQANSSEIVLDITTQLMIIQMELPHM